MRDKDLTVRARSGYIAGQSRPISHRRTDHVPENAVVSCQIAAIAVGGSTACATKKFVRTSVGEVNDKVDSLGRSVEETQERTRQNEGKIAEVDQRAQAAARPTRRRKARRRRPTRRTARRSRRRIRRTTAVAKADAVDKASKRLVFEVVLSEDQGNFKFGKKELPDEAKAKLDEMISRSRPIRRAPTSKSKATPTASAARTTTRSSVSSAPKP